MDGSSTLNTAGNVEEYIFNSKMKTSAFFQYSEQQLHAAQIEAGYCALGCSVNRLGNQCLHFYE